MCCVLLWMKGKSRESENYDAANKVVWDLLRPFDLLVLAVKYCMIIAINCLKHKPQSDKLTKQDNKYWYKNV